MRNLKKVLALVLVFALMLSTVVVASATSFPDVAASYSYAEAIDLLASLNILGGYEDGTFKAENNITRAELCKMLYVTFNGMDDATGEMFIGDSAFKDVAKNDWYNGFVNWASNNAIVGGYGDGTFLPNNNVAVKEAIKMAVTTVTDKALTYPMGYIQEAKSQGLLDDVTIASNDAAATRGQVAQLVYNLLTTKSRLCLTASDTSTNLTTGEVVENYVKTEPLTFVFDLTKQGGTDDTDDDVQLVSSYDNVFVNSSANNEEGKITLSITTPATSTAAAKTTTKTYEFDKDVSDLFGQKLVAYTNAKNELVALISVSDVVETTLDKCYGDGTTSYPFSATYGEYSTYQSGTTQYKNYVLDADKVYVQTSTGAYNNPYNTYALVVSGSATSDMVTPLSEIYAKKGYNQSNPVKFIDYDADGTYESVIIDYVGVAQVTNYNASAKKISFTGHSSTDFEYAIGYEAFASGDYSSTGKEENPVYATYTVRKGAENTYYTLSATTTVEGVLTSVSNDTMSAVIDGTTYNAFGKKPDTNTKNGIFNDVNTNIDDTVRVWLDASGYAVAVKAIDDDATYNLNLAKVIGVNETIDRLGNVTATLTAVLPDGTQKTLTLDTTVDADDSDKTYVKFDGTTASAWVTAKVVVTGDEYSYSAVNDEYFATTGNKYDINNQYIHYEIDDDTNQVTRIVAIGDLATVGGPSKTSHDWYVTGYDEDSNAICYTADRGFYKGTEDKMTAAVSELADGFVGMYYEKNNNGELETAYYTAANMPEFFNKGNYTLIETEDGVVAMIVTKSATATASDKVLGIITGWNTVAGEQKINSNNSYRISVTMWVNGETNTYYTKDFTAENLPDTSWNASEKSGLTTGRFVELQLLNDGKIDADTTDGIDVTYMAYNSTEYGSLNWAYATTARTGYLRSVEVKGWTNAKAHGWSTDNDGNQVYNPDAATAGTITTGDTMTLILCDETTYITIDGTANDFPSDATTLLQEVSTSKLTAGGTIEQTDADTDTYYIFAYNLFGKDEAKDDDNEGNVKTVFIFTSPLDCTSVD